MGTTVISSIAKLSTIMAALLANVDTISLKIGTANKLKRDASAIREEYALIAFPIINSKVDFVKLMAAWNILLMFAIVVVLFMKKQMKEGVRLRIAMIGWTSSALFARKDTGKMGSNVLSLDQNLFNALDDW